MSSINDIRTKFERLKGKKEQVEKTITCCKTDIKIFNTDMVDHEEAREVLRIAGLATQQSLSFHISEITSLALSAIFDEPYQLVVDFVERRNKTECDLYFSRNGSKVKPMDASGGGSIDVASFALRIASWSMQNPKSRNVIILDEPLKYLSAEYQEKGSIMIQEVSQRLGIQFIIVTHEPVLASYADKTFYVDIKQGKSTITTINDTKNNKFKN